MKTLVIALAAVALWAGEARCDATWWTTNPGGGGNFATVDVSLLGPVLVGSDVSGLYRRSGASGSWTRVGYFDGLIATNVLSLRFSQKSPLVAICGTGNGVHRSADGGASWSIPSQTSPRCDFDHEDVSAVGWGSKSYADSMAVFAAWTKPDVGTGSRGVRVAISENKGVDWYEVATPGIQSGDDDTLRVPIKIMSDPTTTGSTRDIYVLFGITARDGCNKREIWRSQTNGTSFERIAPRGNSGGGVDGPMYPIDMSFEPDENKLLVTCSDSSDVKINDSGFIYTFNAGSPQWTKHAVTVGGNAVALTGAVWTDGTYDWCLNVQKDACPSIPTAAGLWRTTKGSTTGWSRQDDGSTWEKGWADCPNARGMTISNVANSVSADGQYWATAMFVWRYDGSQFTKQHTDSESSPWNTTNLDNVNVAALALDGNEDLWAGYYDIGLWKRAASGWTNQNNNSDDEWNDGDDLGGNVNGILFDGSTTYVTEAPSSKTKNWRLWKSVSGGAWSKVSPGPPFTANNTFLRSLCKGSKYWLSVNGAIYYSSDAANWTAAPLLPTSGGLVSFPVK